MLPFFFLGGGGEDTVLTDRRAAVTVGENPGVKRQTSTFLTASGMFTPGEPLIRSLRSVYTNGAGYTASLKK